MKSKADERREAIERLQKIYADDPEALKRMGLDSIEDLVDKLDEDTKKMSDAAREIIIPVMVMAKARDLSGFETVMTVMKLLVDVFGVVTTTKRHGIDEVVVDKLLKEMRTRFMKDLATQDERRAEMEAMGERKH